MSVGVADLALDRGSMRGRLAGRGTAGPSRKRRQARDARAVRFGDRRLPATVPGSEQA